VGAYRIIAALVPDYGETTFTLISVEVDFPVSGMAFTMTRYSPRAASWGP